ncbi:MAG: DUF354 domain-containing protein [Melioribacter sp.]|uniref:DUF354 domain-containing protein n=1 Tax=Melioribacter sp. TaxID=2052167 RepID=UPI003BCCA605
MKIMIDIGHPAHVHYFRNFIKIMEGKGHKFLITARDKEVTQYLLQVYNLNYINRGTGRKGIFGKFLYIIEGNYILLKSALKFKPDLFLSFSSPYAAQVSWLLGKPHIAFDDTEHAKYEHLMYVPFTDAILTPDCFLKDFGNKHLTFAGYMELSYLHPNRFMPDKSVLKQIGIKENEKYVIIRLVSWNASHDWGYKGMDKGLIYSIIDELAPYAKIFISSEGNMPENLIKYKLNIPPEKLHDLLAFASLYIGEGATTASECIMMGVPAIYVNKLDAGTLQDQIKYGLIINKFNENEITNIAKSILSDKSIKEKYNKYKSMLYEEKIDVTTFMEWFVENYPESFKILKKNPNYQYNFK